MKHYHFRSYIYILCVALLTIGCADEVDLSWDTWFPNKMKQSFVISSENLMFPYEGDTQTLSVVSDMEWTIVEKPTFVTISPMSGGKGTTTITVSATINNKDNHLNGNITFGLPAHPSFKRRVSVAQLFGGSFTVNGIKFNMIFVEHGNFSMGSSDSDAYNDERPVHDVNISKDYYIGETEVTQGLWYAVTGQKFTDIMMINDLSGYGVGDEYPVYYISYEDVQSFITKLNQLTGQQFRMPTEAEWEYAAKGGNKSKGYKYSGSNTIEDVAWYRANCGGETHPVKTKDPNELGIYDMCGNVWECCSDWYYGSYSGSAVTDPTGPTSGSYRVIRGGSWFNNAADCRSTKRYGSTPTSRHSDLGFRLAL